MKASPTMRMPSWMYALPDADIKYGLQQGQDWYIIPARHRLHYSNSI